MYQDFTTNQGNLSLNIHTFIMA